MSKHLWEVSIIRDGKVNVVRFTIGGELAQDSFNALSDLIASSIVCDDWDCVYLGTI